MLNATDEIRYSAFDNPVTVNTSHHPKHHQTPHHRSTPSRHTPTTQPLPTPLPQPPNPAQTPATPSGRQPPAPSRRHRPQVEGLLPRALRGLCGLSDTSRASTGTASQNSPA